MLPAATMAAARAKVAMVKTNKAKVALGRYQLLALPWIVLSLWTED